VRQVDTDTERHPETDSEIRRQGDIHGINDSYRARTTRRQTRRQMNRQKNRGRQRDTKQARKRQSDR